MPLLVPELPVFWRGFVTTELGPNGGVDQFGQVVRNLDIRAKTEEYVTGLTGPVLLAPDPAVAEIRNSAYAVPTGNLKASEQPRIGRCSFPMFDFLRLLACALTRLFRSRARLEAEILVLRHQLNVLRRKAPKRVAFGSIDRLVFAGLYRLAPGMLEALKILKPETVIRWHRAGFRAYWRWKSRVRGGRPKTPLEIRQLIRDMSIANPLWGAPRIHGELLMLGIDVGQTTVVGPENFIRSGLAM